ncbi:MAG: sulfatase-like hydrolase/transferase [Planctomycetota bacterium]
MKTSDRRWFTALLLLAMALVHSASAETRPNILLILVDDLGYSDASYMGGEVPTPHLDQLAGNGLRFTQVYNSARCCPSRASLMTGLYPHQAGIGAFATNKPSPTKGPAYLGHLNDTCITLAEALGEAGYQRYMVGKWHMGVPGPIERGFEEFYGYIRNHSEDQWDPSRYKRLPQERTPELMYKGGGFYATDVFTDYTLEFLEQARQRNKRGEKKPWLMYLAHSSPHFPIQAPKESIDRHMETYRVGWDKLREQRFERMKEIGLAEESWVLTDRSIVPVDREDIANGYPGKQNPVWEELPSDRREDLARRMATYAAMVEHVDQGIGKIVEDLKTNGELDNTIILFVSDNGACYEWGPYGFDERSRAGKTTLHMGEALNGMGGPGTYSSYGSGWANLGNTPLRSYKHFTYEGGNCTPMIAHWPAGIKDGDRWVREPAHFMDILPTLLEATGVSYPDTFKGKELQPVEGVSLMPLFEDASAELEERPIASEHYGARSLRHGKWKVVYPIRVPWESKWELYNIDEDRCESRNLAADHPDVVKELSGQWMAWAKRVGVHPFNQEGRQASQQTKQFRIDDRPLKIEATVELRKADQSGVIVAQGGQMHGFALHLQQGKVVFSVRRNQSVVSTEPYALQGLKAELSAHLARDGKMALSVAGEVVATANAGGMINVQPQDPFEIGKDSLTAAGPYTSPYSLGANITAVSVNGQQAAASTNTGLAVVDDWRYTLEQPEPGWEKPDFNDTDWKAGKGGFGSEGTPKARLGTAWYTNNIWLRKQIKLTKVPDSPALLIYHDEDVEVFLNGQSVFVREGFITDYAVVALDTEQVKLLREGMNVLAVSCKQTGGGQFIDVHLIDANRVPELPQREMTVPFEPNTLMTVWGRDVTPDNAWTEYPRPQMRRDQWVNLNGRWDYAITGDNQKAAPKAWAGEILVPFPIESSLSGVERLLKPTEALWYRRSFEAPKYDGGRLLLHFEAVDYRCEVFVNGKPVGGHVGGSSPFSLDITDAVKETDNELLVRVEDETGNYQLVGKQALIPKGVWYTRVSGIWQTVWLEPVPESSITNVKITTQINPATIVVAPETTDGNSFRVVVKDKDKVIVKATGEGPVTIKVPGAKLWTPVTPHLYDVIVQLLDDDGNVIDTVESYAGIRTVGKKRDADGHLRFTLNGEFVFHFGTLDQGWWPDGLLTPPSDEAMKFDIEWLKLAGFNMIRKHIKVEPRRYYYHCDKIGMLVWQDQPCTNAESRKTWPKWTRLKPNPSDADWPDEAHEQYMHELDQMITTLESHPSIVMWVPFNEAWGQHRSMKVGKWIVERDPTRLMNVASGGNFFPVGDVVDHHQYPHPGFPFEDGANGRLDNYVKVVGEFGGHGLPAKGHQWKTAKRAWGYGGLPKDEAEYKQRYVESIRRLADLRAKGIAGGVYTQTTDVEGEINGLLSYDRHVQKLRPIELEKIHKQFLGDMGLKKPKVKVHDPMTELLLQYKTDGKPKPVMSPEEIRAGLKTRDKALYIKAGWIRDPYITLGPDDYYYLTGTQPTEGDPREADDPYNIGLGPTSIVGNQVRVYRSKDLAQWERLGPIFEVKDTIKGRRGDKIKNPYIWAPEVHWVGDRWALVHCPLGHASLALSPGKELAGPWTHPMGDKFGKRHDPSFFTDDDGQRYLLWANTKIAPLSTDLTSYTAKERRIDPSTLRTRLDGTKTKVIGHEGATMIKVGEKYVSFGTAWSTDLGRRGSYNLYYTVADNVTGPYGERQFAGRFLGHGTPFQDRDGNWWCTAFFNGNSPPLPAGGIQQRDLRQHAQTINEQGVTIVPLDVRMLEDGRVYIRAIPDEYATPGPEETQTFD